jgi:hypothetical protein
MLFTATIALNTALNVEQGLASKQHVGPKQFLTPFGESKRLVVVAEQRDANNPRAMNRTPLIALKDYEEFVFCMLTLTSKDEKTKKLVYLFIVAQWGCDLFVHHFISSIFSRELERQLK